MNIKKLGHCALIIQENGVTLLTDPGMFTTAQNSVTGIDAVLITHEHGDHLHIESLKTVLLNNPNAVVITNSSVAAILEKEQLKVTVNIVENGGSCDVGGMHIEAYGNEHAPIYPPIIRTVQNTGYFIAGKFFYPGDALTVPGKPVDTLALPICGPWIKISEVVDYAKTVKPRQCFPVHDGIASQPQVYYGTARTVLTGEGIQFMELRDGQELNTY